MKTLSQLTHPELTELVDEIVNYLVWWTDDRNQEDSNDFVSELYQIVRKHGLNPDEEYTPPRQPRNDGGKQPEELTRTQLVGIVRRIVDLWEDIDDHTSIDCPGFVDFITSTLRNHDVGFGADIGPVRFQIDLDPMTAAILTDYIASKDFTSPQLDALREQIEQRRRDPSYIVN